MNQQDRTNQDAWVDPWTVKWLATIQGFTDEGERAVYWRIVDEVRNKPILDLGVGAGRTIALLRSLSAQYVAIDYLPVMVASARRRFPFVDVQLGDARDLSRFADHSFSLVAFSHMGIDAVDHEDRRRILTEASRVLKPNGIFWFSTLNKEGKAPRQRPWSPRWPQRGRDSMRYALEMFQAVKRVPRDTINDSRKSAR